jgi:hypothetical protein
VKYIFKQVTCIKIKKNREVYKKLLRKGEKYKIGTTHHVIRTKKNDVTTESMNCKNGDVPQN